VGMWCVVCDRCVVGMWCVCGVWCVGVACSVWCVVCGVWCVWWYACSGMHAVVACSGMCGGMCVVVRVGW
jgi:hypothetical protein